MNVKLDPMTCGCVDLDCGTCEQGAHECDARPGSVLTCGCTRRFRLGDTLRLVPFPERWGRPRFACTTCSDGTHEIQENAAAAAAKAEYGPWMADHQGWRPSPDAPPRARASFQWQGTDTVFSATCGCGAPLDVHGDFVYHVECSACGQGFLAVSEVEVEELEPAGVAS